MSLSNRLEDTENKTARTLARLYGEIHQYKHVFLSKVSEHLSPTEQLIDGSKFPQCRGWIDKEDIQGRAFCLPEEEYESNHPVHWTSRGLGRPIQRVNFIKGKPKYGEYFEYVTVPGISSGKKRALLKGILAVDNNGFRQEFIFDYDAAGKLTKVENFLQGRLVGTRTAHYNMQGVRIREEGVEYDLYGKVARREKMILREGISDYQITEHHQLTIEKFYTMVRTIACRQPNGKMAIVSRQKFTSRPNHIYAILGISHPGNLLEYNTGILQLVCAGKYDASRLSPLERNTCNVLDFTDPDAESGAMQNILTAAQRARLQQLNVQVGDDEL